MASSEIVTCKELLVRHGFRLTARRVALLLYLKKAKKPLTAGDIQKSMTEKMNKVTLYRALEDFVEAHILTTVKLQGNALYYEFLHNNHHHHHIVCTACMAIEDIEIGEKALLREALTKSLLFTEISSHTLEFFGICKKCQRTQP